VTAVQHRELLKPTVNRDWIQLLAQVKRDGLAGLLAPALFLLTTHPQSESHGRDGLQSFTD
jgi:hypothetical protein